MNMLEFPIRRYQFTLVAFMLLVAIGWFTFTSIPREEDPSFKFAGFQIAAIMPGADPKDLVASIEARLASHRGLALAGNAYRGVGVPQCIQSGEQAAERTLARLRPGPHEA